MEGSQHFQGTQITQERQGAQTPTDVVQFDITALYVPEMPSRSTP